MAFEVSQIQLNRWPDVDNEGTEQETWYAQVMITAWGTMRLPDGTNAVTSGSYLTPEEKAALQPILEQIADRITKENADFFAPLYKLYNTIPPVKQETTE